MKDTFVKGKSNEVAVNAAENFVTGDQKWRAVFLYGPTGCGKTHLTYVVKHRLEEQEEAVRVRNAEQLISEMIGWLSQGGTMESFYKNYEQADVLLIEDIQNLVRIPQGEKYCKELVRRYLKGQKKVWLTADQKAVIYRWRIFGSFRKIKIAAQEESLKKEILRRYGETREFKVPEEVLELLAGSKENMRKIMGLLNKGMVYERVLGNRLTRELLDKLQEEDRMKALRSRTREFEGM